MIPAIPGDSTAAEARALLEAAGWRQIGRGDWSWVLADPSDSWAARVTSFDPAYRMHAEDCLAGPPNRWLATIAAIVPLRRDAFITVMPRLYPSEEKAAEAFCAALAIRNDSGYSLPAAGDLASDTAMDALRVRLLALLDEGARRFQLWGGSDIRPGNVMADTRGNLKLVDPVFVRGKDIVGAIVEGRRDRLSDFTRAQLEDFLTNPVFEPGAGTDALRSRLASLYP